MIREILQLRYFEKPVGFIFRLALLLPFYALPGVQGQEYKVDPVATVTELYPEGTLDVAVDSAGGVHVVYGEYLTINQQFRTRLQYAYRARPNEAWTFVVAADVDRPFTRAAIAVNNEGRPRIAWMSNEGLKFKRGTSGGTWFNDEMIDATISSDPNAGLDLHYDPATETYYIAYTDFGGRLRLAVDTLTDSWGVNQVVSDFGYQPSLVPPRGLFGRAKIASYDPTGTALMFAEQVFQNFTLVWETRTVTTNFDSGRNPSS